MTTMEQMTIVETPGVIHLSKAELEAGVEIIRQSPKDKGQLQLIVIRPEGEKRIVLQECELSPVGGAHGDNWESRGTTLKAQVTLMNSRAAALMAQSPDRWQLAGDQLYVDFDLSDDNLKPGDHLKVGAAILEVSDKPHTGCAKFSARFGVEAHRFVNSEMGKFLHLRGINATVVQSGVVMVGDVVTKG